MINTIKSYIKEYTNKQNLPHLLLFSCIFLFFIVFAFFSHTLLFIYSLMLNALFICFFFRKKRKEVLLYLVLISFPLLLMAGIGLLTAVLNLNRDFHAALRDLYYLFQGVSYISLGFFCYKKNNSSRLVFGVIILSSLSILLFNFFKLAISDRSFTTIRLIFLNGYQVELFAFFICFHKLVKKEKIALNLCLSILFLAGVILTISRLIVIVLIPFILIEAFRILGLKKGLIIAAGIIVIVVAFLIYINSAKDEFSKELLRKLQKGLEEISPFHNWTPAAMTACWRGYELYASGVDFATYNFFNMLFGRGCGYLIPIHATSLGGTMLDAIPITHNVYGALLCKYGIIGICLYIYFSIQYFVLKKEKDCFFETLGICISIDFLLTSMVSQGPLVNSQEMPMFFILGVLFGQGEWKRYGALSQQPLNKKCRISI